MADDAPKKRGRPKKSEAPKEIDWAEELGQQMDALAAQQREASKFAADFLKKQQRIREANEKARQKAELAALKAEEALAKAQIEEEEARKKAAEQRSQEIAKFLARQKEQQKNREKELKAERDATLDAETKLAEEQLKQEEELQKQLNQTQKKLEKLEKKRSKVIDNLTKKFGSSNVAKVFAGKYVDKEGKISKEGEKTAQRMQRQRTFIKSLVSELARLPIFQKAGRAFQQFGLMNVFAGISKIRKGGFGNIVAGSGQTLFGLGIMLVPALATAFGTVMSTIVANKIAEAVALGTMKGNAGSGGGGFWFGGKGKRTGLRGAPKTAWGRTAFKVATSPVGRTVGKVGGVLAIASMLGDLFSTGMASRDLASKGDKRGAVTTGVAGLLRTGLGIGGMVLGSAGGPLGALVGGIVGDMIGGLLTPLIMAFNSPTWFDDLITFLKRALPWLKDDKKPSGNKKWDEPGLYTPVPGAGLPVRQSEVNVNAYTRKEDSARIRNIFGQYGVGKRNIGINTSTVDKDKLYHYAKTGQYNLELLRADGKNVRFADTFENDVKAGRKGTSALLSMVAQQMQSRFGAGPLVITSALSSKTSPHGPGDIGHAGGQTFDFDAAGMNETQANLYAARLMSTGYFSQATAEYDKKRKQWHIDARLSDEAYKMLEQQQAEVTKTKAPTNVPAKSSSVAKEPPGTDKSTPIPAVNSQGNVNGGQFCAVNY